EHALLVDTAMRPLRDPGVQQDLGREAAGFDGERDALARERMDEGRGIAEQEVAGPPEGPAGPPGPGEPGQVQREADGPPLEARGGEVPRGLGAPAVLAEALLEEAAVGRVTVSHVRPALAVAEEWEDPEVATVLEVEEEDVVLRGVREAPCVLADGVDDVVVGHGSGGP